MNLARYVNNSPDKYIDPSGLVIQFIGSEDDVVFAESLVEQIKKESKAAATLIEEIEASAIFFNFILVHDDPEILGGRFGGEDHAIDVGDIEHFPKAGVASQSSLLFHELRERWHRGRNPPLEHLFAVCHEKAQDEELAVFGQRPAQKPDRGAMGGQVRTLTWTYTGSGKTTKVIIQYRVPRKDEPRNTYTGNIVSVEVKEQK